MKSQEQNNLRQKAEQLEAKYSSKKAGLTNGTDPSRSETDIAKLLYELEVHQIELELQNEELQLAKQNAEKYTNLYDFAPSGYFTLDSDGRICEVNFNGTRMLGKERSKLINSKFELFVTLDTREVFTNFLEKVSKTKTKQNCEVRFMIDENLSIFVLIEGLFLETEQKYLLTVADISELKQAEVFSQAIIDKNPMPMQIVDSEGYTIKTNAAHTRLFGIEPPPDYSILKDKQIIDQGFVELFERVKAGEDVKFNDFYFNIHEVNPELPDKPIWLRLVIFSLFDKTGNQERFVLMHEDITERKHTEKVLLAEKLFSESLINSLPGVFYLISEERKFLRWNTKFETVTGRSAKEMAHISPMDLFEAEDKQSIATAIQRVFTHGQVQVEGRFVAKNGKRTPYHFSGDKIRVDGAPCLIGVGLDISERKSANAELLAAKEKAEESENRLKLALFSGQFGIWDWNVKDNVMIWDERMFELYGITKDTFPNNLDAWTNGLHPEDKQRAIDECNSALNGERDFNTTFRVVHPDGTIIYIHGNGLVLRDTENKAVRMIGVNKDITKSKLAEEELLKAKDQAEESDRLKSAFLANMSHEIRTPMNGILGFADLLKQPELSGEKQQKYIKIIENSGARMLSTINEIIDISKIEAGLMKVNYTETDVNEKINFIYTFFKPQTEEKGIHLSFKNTLPAKEAFIKSDNEKIFSILTNLVKNAIKYTKKGEIELGYTLRQAQGTVGEPVEPAELQFYVKDTGIGIPKDRQTAIFERFIQADISDKMAFQGAGLGLSISKALVEMLGGKIWVESEVGKGSVFYFTLPYQTQPSEKIVPENNDYLEESVTGANLKVAGLKILVADDDETSEMFISVIVTELSKEILVARTGIEAVDLCRNNPDIDLILMDIQMPGLNGHEATWQIRQFNKNVVIIAQTAFALSGDKEKAIAAGCNDYISKPISKDKLLELIQKYFKK